MVLDFVRLPSELQACILPENANLRDALQALDSGAFQIALSVQPSGILEGILTDGNVRRALLGGATLETSVGSYLNRNFVRVLEDQSRAEALDLMQSLRIKQLPIVDQSGHLRGLHLLDALISPVRLPNEAVILAGGKGMRLRPITEHLPKPMLKVAGRPILERLVLHLAGHGIRRIHLAVNFMAHVIEEHFQDGSKFGCEISYLREAEPLGTAGPLSLLESVPEHPLLVINGDLVTQFDAGSLLREHSRTQNALTIGAKLYSHQVPFGCVTTEGPKVTKIVEKPTISRLVNAGIYVLDPSVISKIPREQTCQMTDFITNLINNDLQIGVFELQDDWIDVGHRDSLSMAQSGV